jgi:hypothetical protein
MTRAVVRIGSVVVFVLVVGGLVAAQKPGLKDVPLVVTFADSSISKTTCAAGPGWCGDGGLYESDSLERYLMAEITYHDSIQFGIGGSLRFYLASTSGRGMTFHFGEPLPAPPLGSWCPERCPGPPLAALPNFSTDPIKEVYFQTNFGYSPPNYDFLNPGACDYNADGVSDWDAAGGCATDFSVRILTARKEYRLRISPNIWRTLALPNTLPYGAVRVEYQAPDRWTLTPLLSYDFGGSLGTKDELCPAAFERKDVVRGMNTWIFLGCYDMPFEMTLTKR